MTCGGNVVHKPSYGWHLACLGDQRMWVVCSQAMFVGYQIVDTLFGWTTIGAATVNRLHRPFSQQPAFQHSMLLCSPRCSDRWDGLSWQHKVNHCARA